MENDFFMEHVGSLAFFIWLGCTANHHSTVLAIIFAVDIFFALFFLMRVTIIIRSLLYYTQRYIPLERWRENVYFCRLCRRRDVEYVLPKNGSGDYG